MLVSQQLNGLYFASLYRNCIQFLPAETLAPQLEYRSFIKDAVQRTQKCRVLIKVLTPESRIFVAGENHVKIAFLVVATVDQVKEQPRIQAGSDTVLRFYLRQTVSKDGGDIDALTGATVTSRAVTRAVNAALAYAGEVQK